MVKTFKTQFYPTASEEKYIRQACGVRRWTWNWAVSTYFAAAKNENRFPSAFDLQKQLNNNEALNPTYSWLTEVNSMARQEALKDFGLSLKAYVKARQRAKRTVEKIPIDKYKPSYKKKGKCVESFRLMSKSGTEFKVHSAHDFSVVTTRGRKRMHIHPLESVDFLKSADIKTVTFSIVAGRFFISIVYEKANRKARATTSAKVSIDLGIKHAMAIYDGAKSAIYDVPETFMRAEKRTERCNRALAKTQVGSNRHKKCVQRLQRACLHEANAKKDWREKTTAMLVANYGKIVIDDFGFEGAKNLNVNRSLYRVGPYAFKQRLEEKAAEAGAEVSYIPRGTPTSQVCSACGHRPAKKIGLEVRTYVCEHCGNTIDRDVNAAVNVYNYR